MDYSKWDRMAADMSDDDERPGRPQVTRLDGPSRVTIGQAADQKKSKDGLDYSRWDAIQASSSDDESDEEPYDSPPQEISEPTAPAPAPAPESATATAPTPAVVEAKEPENLAEQLVRNGGKRERYLWSQDAEKCVISVHAPTGTRAKEVRVELAEKQFKSHLRVCIRGDAVLEGDLRYPIEREEDEDEENPEPDWEMKDLPDGRVVCVTLIKKKVDKVVIWWACVLQGESEIDTSALAGRSRKAKSDEYKKAWEEAHAMFKDRVAQRVPQEIDI